MPQTGWTQSYPASGYHQETFESGKTYEDNDFGNFTGATKKGIKFNDLDGDGKKDVLNHEI